MQTAQPSPIHLPAASHNPNPYCSIDEAEYEDPDKINQSPLTFEGFAPAVAFFVVSIAPPLSLSAAARPRWGCLAQLKRPHTAAGCPVARFPVQTLLRAEYWAGQGGGPSC